MLAFAFFFPSGSKFPFSHFRACTRSMTFSGPVTRVDTPRSKNGHPESPYDARPPGSTQCRWELGQRTLSVWVLAYSTLMPPSPTPNDCICAKVMPDAAVLWYMHP